MLIGIIGWVVLGGLIGLAVSKIIDLRGDDPRVGIALSAAGGLLGGWIYSLISGAPVSAFNVWSLLCAALAAGMALSLWHLSRSRRPYQQPTRRRSY
jgi:uncharacterized membrane protein YeaQ/YmgE (transglycosylase-associated protein family)